MPAELVGSNATRETVGCQSFPGFTRPANHRYTVTTDRMRRVCSPRVRCPSAVPPADTADIYASVGNSDT